MEVVVAVAYAGEDVTGRIEEVVAVGITGLSKKNINLYIYS